MESETTPPCHGRPGELAWALAMLLVALGIVAVVAAVPVGLFAGRTAALVMVSIGAGLAVLSIAPATVFLRTWRCPTETYHELIARTEAALECMPHETRQAGGEEILAALRRDLAVLEGQGHDRGPGEP